MVFVCHWFRFGSIDIVWCIHQIYPQLFTKSPVAMVTHLEKVSTLVLIGCIEKYLFRIWYDTYEGTAIFHTFLDFTYRTEEKFLGGKDVVKRKVETHDVKLSVWTLV